MNAELMLTTLEHIDANRREWSQYSWRTCFAAHAALLEGGRWVGKPDSAAANLFQPEMYDRPGDLTEVKVGRRKVTGVPVAARARRLLDLTEDQAERLFLPTNDLGRLHWIVSDLIEQAKEAAA